MERSDTPMHYKIVTATKITDLEKAINNHLAAGFEPVGGLIDNGMVVMQAVLYKPKTTDNTTN